MIQFTDRLEKQGVSVSKWVVSCVTDILIAFSLATLLLWYGATSHPEFFPRSFFQYWGAVVPVSASSSASVPEVASGQVSPVVQVQR